VVVGESRLPGRYLEDARSESICSGLAPDLGAPVGEAPPLLIAIELWLENVRQSLSPEVRRPAQR
jgi:hypothetical protein